MPFYDYRCTGCGDFSQLRPMAQCREPATCPACGTSADRIILATPSLGVLSGAMRRAYAANERSAHAPRSTAGGHGMNCGCCKPGAKNSRTVRGADGSKSAPSARPWMISH
jgi:putative FmdB family regulatory protein